MEDWVYSDCAITSLAKVGTDGYTIEHTRFKIRGNYSNAKNGGKKMDMAIIIRFHITRVREVTGRESHDMSS